ncbi:MAG: transporter substrate-binding protein PnrA-like [Actinomycetia bacterium]|nr:transporter substrate-binding protein PnrA-like [Actinomycetes bacterium]
MRAVLIALALLCGLAAAGCGGAHKTTTTVSAKRASVPPPPLGLRVGVVGPLEVKAVPGASITRGGRLATMPAYPLVLVSAQSVDLAAVDAVAARYPTSHYAYVGGSTKGHHRPNLVGLVLNDGQAAQLGGVVAGLVAAEQGGMNARIAWVGPQERALAAAFARGANAVQPGTTVLRAWSGALPASCKEAALGAIARGAVVVMAHGGLCGEAAIAGAHQQNHVGLQLSDFELPSVPAGVLIGDAVAGVFRGGEDIVFGASTGAIGVRHLDPGISPDIAVGARAAAQQLASGLPLRG